MKTKCWVCCDETEKVFIWHTVNEPFCKKCYDENVVDYEEYQSDINIEFLRNGVEI